MKNLKKVVFGLMLALSTSSYAQDFSAANTDRVSVNSIETRESGYHSIFLWDNVNGDRETTVHQFPDQGCSLTDRGVIVGSDAGAKAMLASLITADINEKDVVLRVNGCVELLPGSSVTAPKIVKVQYY